MKLSETDRLNYLCILLCELLV